MIDFFPSDKIFVEIFGTLNITYYSLSYLLGTLVACYFGYKLFKKNGYGIEEIEDLTMGCFFFGIMGARIWYCLFYDFSFYMSNPVEIVKIWTGGLAIQGGLFGGALFVIYYCRKNKINVFRMGDAILINILLAQAIGRWGNFANKEAYGDVVSASYFDGWPKFIADGMFIAGEYRMPTFFFESVLNLIGWALVYFIFRKIKSRKRGDMMYAYLVWYGISRYIVEGLRTDSLMIGSFRMAQLTSIVFIIIGLVGFAGVFRKIFKSKKPVILFDLDGTILDTEKAILETYRQLFIKYSTEKEFTPERQLEVLGPPLKKMFPVYFPGQNVDDLIVEYRAINMDIHKEFVVAMNNAEKLLHSLKQQGYKLGIVSTKMNAACTYGLEITNLLQYFDIVIGEDEVNVGKPNPEGIFKACELLNEGHDSCIYVGDSATDIYAGKNAGVYTIGYIFNQQRKDVLINTKPNKVITDLIEIEEILKEKVQWTHDTM